MNYNNYYLAHTKANLHVQLQFGKEFIMKYLIGSQILYVEIIV